MQFDAMISISADQWSWYYLKLLYIIFCVLVSYYRFNCLFSCSIYRKKSHLFLCQNQGYSLLFYLSLSTGFYEQLLSILNKQTKFTTIIISFAVSVNGCNLDNKNKSLFRVKSWYPNYLKCLKGIDFKTAQYKSPCLFLKDLTWNTATRSHLTLQVIYLRH